MPPKRKASSEASGSKNPKMKNQSKGPKRVAAKGFTLPDPIEPGEVLTDVARKSWRLGKSIGVGGFGEIYLASDNIDKAVDDSANYCVKIEPHTNGPLFTEMHCYMRVAKLDDIEAWKKEHKLKHLGMTRYHGSGSHTYKNIKYRFLVMERFGPDLQKVLDEKKNKLTMQTVYQIGLQILDVYEYLHSKEYIHADVKTSNLCIGRHSGTENNVFLVDLGLSTRFTSGGKHKERKFDPRKAHDGTIEYTSRDAHIGVPSRRADLEILGYNMVQWLCGKLPWEDKLQNCDYVAQQKIALMNDVNTFITCCSGTEQYPGLLDFVQSIANLEFEEKPDYEKFRNILRKGLKAKGLKDDDKLVFTQQNKKSKKTVAQDRDMFESSEEDGNIDEDVENKGGVRARPRNASKGIKTQAKTKEMVVKPQRRPLTSDPSLSNPTPAMLELMKKRGLL